MYTINFTIIGIIAVIFYRLEMRVMIMYECKYDDVTRTRNDTCYSVFFTIEVFLKLRMDNRKVSIDATSRSFRCEYNSLINFVDTRLPSRKVL